MHAPFSDIALHARGKWLSSLRKIACALTPRDTLMTATYNPQAAADQARAAYRDTTAQLGHLGLDTAIPEGVRGPCREGRNADPPGL